MLKLPDGRHHITNCGVGSETSCEQNGGHCLQVENMKSRYHFADLEIDGTVIKLILMVREHGLD
jgi:hypothetical protein